MAQIACYITGISVVGEEVYATGVCDELPVEYAAVNKADLDAQPTPNAKMIFLATAMRQKQLRSLVLDPRYAALKGHVTITDPVEPKGAPDDAEAANPA